VDARRQQAEREAKPLRESVEAALNPANKEAEVEFAQLLRLYHWSTLSGEADRPRREVADDLLERARTAFMRAHPDSRLGLFPVGGVFRPEDGGALRVAVLFRVINFNSSDARALAQRIDAISDAAVEWWPDVLVPDDDAEAAKAEAKAAKQQAEAARDEYRVAKAAAKAEPKADPESEQPPGPHEEAAAAKVRAAAARATAKVAKRRYRRENRKRRRAVVRRAFRRILRGPPRSPTADRLPHLNRAYDLATSVCAAITNENTRHHDAGEPAMADTISPQHKDDLRLLEQRIVHAERLLDAAGQRTAQARYGRGMFWGTVLLALVTGAGATAFYYAGVDAVYGIALPAGAIGAVVSVLQRMTGRRFRLDLESSGNLAVAGTVRPMIGSIFGLLIMGLFESNLLSLNPSGGSKLALYGVLGFAAGFNERFAQDALSSSLPAGQAPPAAAQPQAQPAAADPAAAATR
jgi:hypothetical protein